jgi:hypothetical protein
MIGKFCVVSVADAVGIFGLETRHKVRVLQTGGCSQSTGRPWPLWRGAGAGRLALSRHFLRKRTTDR